MPCPYQSLVRLPGQIFDGSARELHVRFAAVSDDEAREAVAEALARNAPRADTLAIQRDRYALSGFVIQAFWRFVQRKPYERAFSVIRRDFRGATHQEKVWKFSLDFLLLLEELRKNFFDEYEGSLETMEPMPSELSLQVLFQLAGKELDSDGGLAFPSMADLVVMFSRIAGVIPEVFERDLGHEPTEAELLAVLRHSSMKHFFAEIMTNSRATTYPLLDKLEQVPKGDLNVIERTFAPEFFEIVSDKGPHLRLKPSFIATHRAEMEQAATERAALGEPEPRAFGCPALYTGKFREMYDWVSRCFERWYRTADP